MYNYSLRREYYKDKQVAESYDAKRFHSLAGRVSDWLDKYSLLRTLAFLPQGGSILDLACGTGRITKFLAQRGFQVLGADISEEMLQAARKRLANLNCFRGVCQSDAERLPFANERFDGVVSVRFFGHIPPHVRTSMLGEMKRVSKGCVIVQYPLSHRVISIPDGLGKKPLLNSSISHLPSLEEATAEFRAVNLEIQAIFPKLRYFLHSWMIVARKGQ